MGKAKRVKAKRIDTALQAGGRHLVVVDGLEVGHVPGVLTLRVAGRAAAQRPEPICVPAKTAAGLLDQLNTAALDAEESYWTVVGSMRRNTGTTDQATVAAALENWLRVQNWHRVVAAVPNSPGRAIVLLSHAGHVGLLLDPPMSTRPLLAILDPLQLHRVRPALQAALASAGRDQLAATTPPNHRLSGAHRFLAAQPWPPVGHHPDPTPAQAHAEMRHRLTDYLTRTPYLRPPEHDLLLPDDK